MNRFIAALALAVTLSTSMAQSTKGLLLALSKTDHTLALVDPVSLQVEARIPVGEFPHEMIASTDGKRAYVTMYDGGSTHTVNVIDLVAKKRLNDVDTRPLYGPHGIAYVKGKVWFSAEGSKAVGRFDPTTDKLDWSMGTGQDRTHMIYVSADGKKIYTTNVTSGSVSILEDTLVRGMFPGAKPREDWTQTLVQTGKGTEGFDVSPDGSQLWSAASEDGSVAVIDLLHKKLLTQLTATVVGANRLKFTPDGKRVLITSLRTGDLAIIDATTRQEVKRLKVGNGAAGIEIAPDGSRAFIAVSADNYVAVLDLKTLTVISRIDVGGVPDGLAWAVRP